MCEQAWFFGNLRFGFVRCIYGCPYSGAGGAPPPTHPGAAVWVSGGAQGGFCSLRGRTQSCVSSETRQRTARWGRPPPGWSPPACACSPELRVHPCSAWSSAQRLSPGPWQPSVSNVHPGRKPARARTGLGCHCHQVTRATCWPVPTNGCSERLSRSMIV